MCLKLPHCIDSACGVYVLNNEDGGSVDDACGVYVLSNEDGSSIDDASDLDFMVHMQNIHLSDVLELTL